MRTITQCNYRNEEVQLTEEQFVKLWINTVAQLSRLIENEEDVTIVSRIQSRVRQLASRNFESVYARQHKIAA